MSTVKSNLKSIVSNSISAPVEAAAVSVEIVADTANLITSSIKGAKPTAVSIGRIVGLFMTGVVNSSKTEDQATKIFNETTIATVIDSIEEASLRAGQNLVKSWDDTEESTTTEKKEVNEI